MACSQVLLTERTISVSAAQEVARVALEQCRKDGHRVTVTVLDHAARTKVVLRDDGASPHKRAAANFPASAGPLNLDKITTSAGGLPIRAGNDVVGGAIGVSGSRGSPNAPGGAADAKCGQAGIERIAAGLSATQ
jgi:uncharacterized protein GlcG (DUF336 family)